MARYGDAGPGPAGSVMSATFQLDGQDFIALNGGAQFKLSPAISLFVTCNTQEEVDELWDKLSAGGKKNKCGWLQDKFGISWQVIPAALGETRAAGVIPTPRKRSASCRPCSRWKRSKSRASSKLTKASELESSSSLRFGPGLVG